MPAKAASKIPMVPEWLSLQDKKYTGEFSIECNAAVITGEISDNLFVLDLDEASIYDDFKEYHNNTFTVESGKGYHLYFRSVGFLPPSANGVQDSRGRSLEIQAHGKYVIAPGSFVIPEENKRHLYPKDKQYGFNYNIICDKEPLVINPQEIKDKLDSLGFKGARKSIDDIKHGTKEGSRDNDTFKFACMMVRMYGLSGKSLEKAVFDLNEKHVPPLPESDVLRIIERAVDYEGGNIERHEVTASRELKKDSPMEIEMQDITPEFEGIPLKFHASVTAVDERHTITKEINYLCSNGHTNSVKHKRFTDLKVPIVCENQGCKSRDFDIDRDSMVTEYIQVIRIEEFLEESKESTPIEFDAEITGDDIGKAFVGQDKVFVAKFRSIPKKNHEKNDIVFEIVTMNDMEQGEGCMPEPEEVERWKETDIMENAVASVAPELLFDPLIKKSLMFSIAGGMGLNGKRSDIHIILLGDAQLGKSELLESFHKLTPGSGYALGGSSTGAGLTAGMVKLYNGTMVLKGGLLPRHTGHPVFIDEGDKMQKHDIMALFECMEQQSVTSAKGGGNGKKRLVAKNNIIFAGNPKNGKYDDVIPVMQNFDMPEPFITRFDILWLIVDSNDEQLDERTRKHIREFKKRQEDYMSKEELQRYFTYVRQLKPTISEELECKLDEIHKKMRVLNRKKDGMNIGWRQYYGLYRLVTACAACNLREEVTQDDIDEVYGILKASLRTLGMDIESGENNTSVLTSAQSKEKIYLEIWTAMADDNGEVDKEEFTFELGKHKPFTPLTAGIEFDKRSANMILNNNTGRYRFI